MASPVLLYKYRALTDCATGATVHLKNSYEKKKLTKRLALIIYDYKLHSVTQHCLKSCISISDFGRRPNLECVTDVI